MARTKLMDCGHGSRHLSPYDGRCRKCAGKSRREFGVVGSIPVVATPDPVKVARAKKAALVAERIAAEREAHVDAA